MSILASTPVTPLASNFLVPNGTFLVELLAFAILVWIFGKYLIPPINKAMTARQEAIRSRVRRARRGQDRRAPGRGGLQGAAEQRQARGRADP